MSASELLAKVDRFLREQTRIDETLKHQSLQLVWQSASIDPLAIAVDSIKNVLMPPTEIFEPPEPGQSSPFLANFSGRRARSLTGTRLTRIVWNLSNAEVPMVARWLDEYEMVLARHKASAFAHRHVAYRWRPQYKGDHPEFPEPNLFGVCLSHPRHIQVPFLFYDTEHYCQIKRYMAEIGLASLLDHSVRPRGALSSGFT